MRISKDMADAHSENSFVLELGLLVDSGAAVIHVRTHEVMRGVVAVRKALLSAGHFYKEWNIAQGFRDFDITNFMKCATEEGDGRVMISEAMAAPGEAAQEKPPNEEEENDKYRFFCFLNLQYWAEGDPLLHHYIQQYSHTLPSTNIRIILITPDISLPEVIADTVATIKLSAPSHTELKGYYDNITEYIDPKILSLDDSEIDKVCSSAAGMSKENFKMYLSSSIVRAANESEKGELVELAHIVAGINKGKTEVINKNDILELYPIESMKDVGGMANLKEWVYKRKDCYSEEAKEFGVEPPKGIVCVGHSGTGKSLVGKSIAAELGVNLIRLDIGRIFNSLVGKSEERTRTALDMIESMSPIVLLIDEIDKGLGGADGSSSDSGTSSRVLGTLLTWLQDCKAPVFTVVTCNSITGLPPELLRRGRFDAIFATSFPTPEERMEILDIHLRKRGRNPKDFKKRDKLLVVGKAKGYVPAEIESAIKDGLVEAFSAGEKFTMNHVIGALDIMVPLSVTYKERVQLMTAWASQNAIPASKQGSADEKATSSNVSSIASKRNIRIDREDQ